VNSTTVVDRDVRLHGLVYLPHRDRIRSFGRIAGPNRFGRTLTDPWTVRETVQTLSPVVSRLGIVLGVLGGVVGLVVHSTEGAVLWALVGYFLGKSIRSTVRTVSGNRAT